MRKKENQQNQTKTNSWGSGGFIQYLKNHPWKQQQAVLPAVSTHQYVPKLL